MNSQAYPKMTLTPTGNMTFIIQFPAFHGMLNDLPQKEKSLVNQKFKKKIYSDNQKTLTRKTTFRHKFLNIFK